MQAKADSQRARRNSPTSLIARRWQIFVRLFALICATTVTFSGCHHPRTAQINIPAPEFNFGLVDEGVEISHDFNIENRGERPLEITKAESTCGCTVPTVKNKIIAPGAIGKVNVRVDTSMKQGVIRKEVKIISTDPIHPVTSVFVYMDVKNPHAGLSARGIAKIFTGRCAACHVNQGIGKMGEDLYMADCAMCHGFRAEGAVGPSLSVSDYHDKNVRTYTSAVISHGSKTHPSMPGFLKSAGGPLTAEQIASIIDYLRWRSDNLH